VPHSHRDKTASSSPAPHRQARESATVRIGVVGAGLIGRRHVEALAIARDVELAAIADPDPCAGDIAARHGVAHFMSLREMIETAPPDGVIIATPNAWHLAHVLECVDAGIAALIEKPLATDLASAERIVAAGKAANIALLIGHHRRHNPLIARARSLIEAGELGQITAVQATAWFHKPDDYFQAAWRRQKGAGPVYLNLSHDIDLLRYLCGEIVSVQAMESNRVRGHEVEETAVILLQFGDGALGTMSVSDTVVAPWSWELTARENPVYPATTEACYLIGGTQASLSLPNLSLWSNPGKAGWREPISATKWPIEFGDPLVRQVLQFAAVIRGDEPPLVPASEGLQNQRVIEAIKTSARTGTTVML